MKVLQIILTGLGTEPVSEPDGLDVAPSEADCGMMGIAQAIDPTSTIRAFSWDDGNPDEECRKIYALRQSVNPDLTIFHAHSFGNSLGAFYSQWVEEWHGDEEQGDIYFGYDPCRHPRFGLRDWRLASNMRRFMTWYQQGGRPFMVRGTPFSEREGGQNIDVTAWRNPTLAHISGWGYTGIIMDSRVRAQVHSDVASLLIVCPPLPVNVSGVLPTTTPASASMTAEAGVSLSSGGAG